MQDWEKSNYEVYLELQHSQESELMHYRTKGALNKKVAQYIKDGGKLINGKIVYAKKAAKNASDKFVKNVDKHLDRYNTHLSNYVSGDAKYNPNAYGKGIGKVSTTSSEYVNGKKNTGTVYAEVNKYNGDYYRDLSRSEMDSTIREQLNGNKKIKKLAKKQYDSNKKAYQKMKTKDKLKTAAKLTADKAGRLAKRARAKVSKKYSYGESKLY